MWALVVLFFVLAPIVLGLVGFVVGLAYAANHAPPWWLRPLIWWGLVCFDAFMAVDGWLGRRGR